MSPCLTWMVSGVITSLAKVTATTDTRGASSASISATVAGSPGTAGAGSAGALAPQATTSKRAGTTRPSITTNLLLLKKGMTTPERTFRVAPAGQAATSGHSRRKGLQTQCKFGRSASDRGKRIQGFMPQAVCAGELSVAPMAAVPPRRRPPKGVGLQGQERSGSL